MNVCLFGILCCVALLASFYCGVLLGISDTKRSYGIAKGVTPEEYDNWVRTLKDMADPYWEEVEDYGRFCP